MSRVRALPLVGIVLVAGLCTLVPSDARIIDRSIRASVETIWERTVRPYLADPLWADRDAYDAGHYLMVPLHAAFYLDRPAWQDQFANYAHRFVSTGYDELSEPPNRETRLQHMYVLSRFAVLAASFDRQGMIPTGLLDLLYDEVHSKWALEPAWQWARDPFPGGMRERLHWKLDTPRPEHSFWRAIIDEEFPLFAIASDLLAYERLTGFRHQHSSVMVEIAAMTSRVFDQEAVWASDGTWVFQPGVWTDHVDYAYAGRSVKSRSLEPAPVEGIAPDTSHSHRYPLWLYSYQVGSPSGGDQFLNFRRGLSRQFFMRVAVPPSEAFPAYRTTNYMDGRNGLYRWEYATQGPDNGYGPYEVSGTMLLGWWIFLGTEPACEMYAQLSDSFPLPQDVLRTYVGPNTSRDRHPLVADPASYTNGFRELIVRLAAQLCDEPRWEDDFATVSDAPGDTD